MKSFHVIGLTGLARSGKDTAADVICSEFGYRRVAFAGPLKEAAAILLNRSLEEVSTGPRDQVLPEFGFTIREFLQKLGTECLRRTFREDFWIVRAEQSIAQAKAEGARGVVITDVRFDNEAAMVKNCGGRVLEVVRPGLVRMDHASEKGVSSGYIDGVIHNDSTLAEFKERVAAIMYFAGEKPRLDKPTATG